MDTLAVRLIVPLVGSIADFHHQVIRPPPRVSEQHQLRRYAPYLAHTKQSQRDAMTLLTSKRNEMMYVLMNNPELTSIVWRCLSGQRVQEHEWSRFRVYLYTTMVTIELGFKKIWADEVDPITSETWIEGADWWLKYPGMRTWWKNGQLGFSNRFKIYID